MIDCHTREKVPLPHLKTKLDEIADILVSKGEEGLKELRWQLVDRDLLDISKEVDVKTLTVSYICKKILVDVWRNLGTDATFNFPEEELGKLSRTLGQFMKKTLSGDSSEQAVSYLSETLQEFYSILSKLDSRLRKGDKIGSS